jgi:hypothetical protein
MAEWLGKGLQNPVPRFDSGCRLSGLPKGTRRGGHTRAISSGGERFLDAEEVSGSNPLSPTLQKPCKSQENEKGLVTQPDPSTPIFTPTYYENDSSIAILYSAATASTSIIIPGKASAPT